MNAGSVWRRLGSEVVVFEAMPEFLAAADKAVSKKRQNDQKPEGMDIQSRTKLLSGSSRNGQVLVSFDAKGQAGQETFDNSSFVWVAALIKRNPLGENSGVQAH